MKLYTPSYFKTDNLLEAADFVNQFPFATVISKNTISHLPLVAKVESGKLILTGHLARANSQSEDFSTNDVTAVFHGPHTFITPVWYKNGGVPTWNYSVLHTAGKVKIIKDYDGIIQCLEVLNDEMEKHYPSGWNFEVPKDLTGDLLTRVIFGFEITVTEIQYKKKLSQNRTSEDRAGVLLGLAQRADEQSKEVRSQMLKIMDEFGNLK